MSDGLAIREAAPVALSLAEAYPILQLRVDVFVVEQDCPYPELDGRDLEPDCRWLWVSDAEGAVLACVRLLTDAQGVRRIGRVATAPTARGRGLAALLLHRCLELTAGAEVVLDAQSQLVGWYAGFGFTPEGEAYLEDGIPHRVMRRPASGVDD
ncbi:GNAT family N-acetyltransferase [Naumannella sp. ID2617S]|nr:GNAT family N-acetyltransferase [Naumannella sp. ID2617S]